MSLLALELADEHRAALAAKARLKGLSVEEYARQVLEQDLAPEWLQRSWESARNVALDQLSGEEIEAEIAAARRSGVKLGCSRVHDPRRF
jgi:plasmid stability protein